MYRSRTSVLPAQEDGPRRRALCPDCAGASVAGGTARLRPGSSGLRCRTGRGSRPGAAARGYVRTRYATALGYVGTRSARVPGPARPPRGPSRTANTVVPAPVARCGTAGAPAPSFPARSTLPHCSPGSSPTALPRLSGGSPTALPRLSTRAARQAKRGGPPGRHGAAGTARTPALFGRSGDGRAGAPHEVAQRSHRPTIEARRPWGRGPPPAHRRPAAGPLPGRHPRSRSAPPGFC